MQNQINKIEETQNGHTAILLDMSKSINRMETAYFGDEEAGIDGMVKQVKDNSKYIQGDRKFKWTTAGVMTMIVLLKDKFLHLFA